MSCRARFRRAAIELGIPEGEEKFRLEEEVDRPMREWVQLAQFGIADVYAGRFLIRHDDLAAGRLDKALSFTCFTE